MSIGALIKQVSSFHLSNASKRQLVRKAIDGQD